MSRPELPIQVRDDWIAAHRLRHQHLCAATRHSHRPLWPDVRHGLALVFRHLCRLATYAVLLVAAVAFAVAYLDRGAPTP